jgi:ribonuclease P protein component
MLNKEQRIGNRKVIEALFKKGKLYKSQFLLFKYEKAVSGRSQFAVSVSKTICKKATKRNRLRRQIYEALKLNLAILKNDFIALVIARPQITEKKVSFMDICECVQKFFNTIQSNAE